MTQQQASGEDFQRHFRNALGMFATGITVVTTRTPAGEPIGLTVNSFNSVSLDPPLIVWSLANELPSRTLFEGCEYYAINVLAEDQADLSQRFASRLGEKFAGLEFDSGVGGAYQALKIGGTASTILNAANEVAVQAFLENKITFTQIAEICAETLNKLSYQRADDLDVIFKQIRWHAAMRKHLWHPQ